MGHLLLLSQDTNRELDWKGLEVKFKDRKMNLSIVHWKAMSLCDRPRIRELRNKNKRRPGQSPVPIERAW